MYASTQIVWAGLEHNGQGSTQLGSIGLMQAMLGGGLCSPYPRSCEEFIGEPERADLRVEDCSKCSPCYHCTLYPNAWPGLPNNHSVLGCPCSSADDYWILGVLSAPDTVPISVSLLPAVPLPSNCAAGRCFSTNHPPAEALHGSGWWDPWALMEPGSGRRRMGGGR